ncbi:MAG TPA: dienelactone hydrolase family protein [Fimbriimonadaceae bacterium]|nr:dienelactone hydrolase family protein [Fimbriimonadaceae bacterium]
MDFRLGVFFVLMALAGLANATIVTKKVEYKQGDAVLEGYLAYDDAKSGPRPGVMIVHDWNGLDDYEEMRARMLAELGYVAFAADIYGKGIRPKNAQESGEQAGKYRADAALFRARLKAGLDELKKQPNVDVKKTAAIGYCFGGGGVMELARSGADVTGVVSFHGGALATTMPAKAGDIKGKVMVVHAAQDPSASRAAWDTFLDEMKDAKVDYQAVVYNLNVHAFTVVGGGQYDAQADHRSWAAMRGFFNEIFGS